MNQRTQDLISKSLISGTVAGIATMAAASLGGKRDAGSYVAPINATSHALWGEAAAEQDQPSVKYTLTGFLFNHASAIFWAAIYEALFSPRPGQDSGTSALRPLLGAAAVTAGAYVTDYYLVPKRLTPGFEKRLSGRSLGVVYGALALGLAAGGLMSRRR